MIFRPELAAAIVKGTKTATRRAISPNPNSPWRETEPLRYPVDKTFAVQPGRGKTSVALAVVTARRIEPLRAVLPADARREGFPTRDGFVSAWRAINGSWDPDQRVHVVEFKLVGLDCPTCGGHGDVWTTWERRPVSCGDCWATGVQPSDEARELVAAVGF